MFLFQSRVCVCVCVRACVRAYARARASARARVRVCVRVCARERNSVRIIYNVLLFAIRRTFEHCYNYF